MQMIRAWRIFITYALFIYGCLRERCAESTELTESSAKPSDNTLNV